MYCGKPKVFLQRKFVNHRISLAKPRITRMARLRVRPLRTSAANEREFTRVSQAESIRKKKALINGASWLVRFWREGSDDFFKPRIAAQGIPKRQEF